jgi:hypothetical protein
VSQNPHYLDFLQFSRRDAVEIDSWNLLDRNEAFLLTVVAFVDVAEGASSKSEEAVVEEALGNLSIPREVDLHFH